jgi:hypothetical protein
MEATTLTEAATGQEIRPFTIDVPEEQLDDLRRRIAATKWPDQETDASQGVRLETIQALADYWATDYDWRRFERRFAALPHFVTTIDGVDIHFIHVRSAHEDALPLVVTHGWPGSTIEQLKIIDPLTKPTENGASVGRDDRPRLHPGPLRRLGTLRFPEVHGRVRGRHRHVLSRTTEHRRPATGGRRVARGTAALASRRRRGGSRRPP